MLVREIARKLEHAGRLIGKYVEPLEAAVVQRGPIGSPGKRQDRVKLETEIEGDVRRDLVGAVREGRDEQQTRRQIGEDVALTATQLSGARLELDERRADPLD